MKKEELHNLFQLNIQNNAPKFIVYTKEITERLGYTCKFIFTHVLNSNYIFSQDRNEFNASDLIKLNYSSEAIANVFQIMPHNFIFEKGINNEFVPESKLQDGLVYFYTNSAPCNLGYDIFSSVFYFISRYQEWQPFEADKHGRFEAVNSIQYKLEQHRRPLVNIWIEELKSELCKFYPDIKFPEKKFQYISTIDVDNLYAYKSKGILRTAGSIVKDLVTFNFDNLSRRLSVLKNRMPDPFDVYDKLNALAKQTNTTLIYFFLQRSNTKFDRTIDPTTGAFRPVFDKLRKEAVAFGLHPSYYSSTDPKLMKDEFSIIRRSTDGEINLSRQHYLRFDIRKTTFQLIDNKVSADFSMGFASSAGYRAGTFTPFYFYDLQKESSTNLLMVPFCVMDGVYFVYSKSNLSDAEKQIRELANEAKRLNGLFITVFHERTFDKALYLGYATLYEKSQSQLG